MTYTYRLLDPRPQARQAELEFLASTPCLGVEVTVPELAAACQYGNIDPQHSGGDPGTSAIEAAVDAELPPDGATLVTVRPDADAYGTMAVLAMRADYLRGRYYGEDPPFDQWLALAEECGCPRTTEHEQGRWCPATHRIAMIGEADRTGDASTDSDPEHVTWLAALRAACLATRDAAAGVRIAREWISLGGSAVEPWLDRVRQERREHAAVAAEVTTAADGRVAVVESTSRFAVQAAYEVADVVVAVNPELHRPGAAADEPAHRKVTVCQRETGHVDLAAVLAELSQREPGWGGSPTIGGSPQGEPCDIPTEDVVAVMVRHMAPPVTP